MFLSSRISRLKKCIADNEHHLSNAENTEYLQKIRGVSSFYLNVCPPGTDITAKYKGNAPCFQLIKNKILSCGSDLPDMTSYKMKNDLDSRCCALSTHRHCVLQASAQNCGKEAAEVVDQILMRYFRHEMEGCQDRGCSDEVTTDNPPGHHNEERRKSEDRSNRSNRKGVGNEPTEEDYDTYSENWKHYTTPEYHSMDSAGSQMSLFCSIALVLLQIILLN
ncbi:uncharacterized protein CEXT_664051 [Caerostris extrusa]|uniref:Uncharacterized protein n=1 Tax=Caerostris extrusa TaxID=172846 RepID=A0AAV4SL63_CAEEX|nr:uncharacterized protein CEXT_664051 [Caerostris extrusa]